MASTPRMIPLAIIFLLLALIAIIAERNPSQPGDEPAFTKVQEVAAGDTLHLEGGVSVCVEQPGFLNSLMPFGTVIGVHTYLIDQPGNPVCKDTCLTGSCSGKDQKRALCIENGLLLSVI